MLCGLGIGYPVPLDRRMPFARLSVLSLLYSTPKVPGGARRAWLCCANPYPPQNVLAEGLRHTRQGSSPHLARWHRPYVAL